MCDCLTLMSVPLSAAAAGETMEEREHAYEQRKKRDYGKLKTDARRQQRKGFLKVTTQSIGPFLFYTKCCLSPYVSGHRIRCDEILKSPSNPIHLLKENKRSIQTVFELRRARERSSAQIQPNKL